MRTLLHRSARALAAVAAGLAGLALAAMAASTAPAPPGKPSATGAVAAPKGGEFTHFRVGNKNVKSMFAEGGVLWVGTSGGAIRYDTRSEEFRLYDVKSGLLSNGIFHVSRIQGRMAFGTYGGGLSFLDEKTGQWENFNVPEGLGDAFVYDVLQASNGDLWIATWSGVNRVRGGALRDRSKWSLHTVESTRGGLINDWVYALAEGKDGVIWMATEGGLVRFQGNRWDNWNHAKGLGAPFEKVKRDIAYKSDPSKVSQHHAKQKVEMGLEGVDVAYNPNYIVALAVDGDGIVWAGTWGGGLSRFDGKSWKTWTTEEGLPGNHVSLLHVDKSGTLWVGTNNGLAQMKDGRFRVLTVRDGLFANTVFSMVSTAADGIWAGSFGGVAHITRPRPR